MGGLLEQFASTSIINLRRRADRRKRVTAQFDAYGVDMEACRVRFVEGLDIEARGHFIHAGVRGCFESHLAQLRACASSGKRMLICEDDVDFNIDALAIHKGNGLKIPETGWDVIYFGLVGECPMTSSGLQPYHGHDIGLHCYGVTAEAAGRVAKYFEENSHT